MAFTDVTEVDLAILTEVGVSDLRELCTSSRYFAELCRDDYLWKTRLSRLIDLPDAPPDGLSWREFYFWWLQHPMDDISSTLSLIPELHYIRKVTETDVIHGSEMFQTLRFLFPKVAKKGDPTLVEYFMDLYSRLDHAVLDLDEVVDWESTVVASIEGHNYTLTEYFLDIYQEQWYRFKGTSDVSLLEVSNALGRVSNRQFFERYIPQTLNNTIAFIKGLLWGGFVQEALRYITALLRSDPYYNYINVYTHILEAVLRRNHREIIEVILDDVKKVPEAYNEFLMQASNHGYVDLVPESMLSSATLQKLLREDPEEAILYYNAHSDEIPEWELYGPTCSRVLLDFYKSLTDEWYEYIDYKQCDDISIFEDAFFEAKGDPRVLQDILYNTRYDLIPLFSYYTPWGENPTLAQLTIENARYKDLMLYFLAKTDNYVNLAQWYVGTGIGVELETFVTDIVDKGTLDPVQLNDEVFATITPTFKYTPEEEEETQE